MHPLDWHEALPEPIFIRDEIAIEILRQVAISSSKKMSELRYANCH